MAERRMIHRKASVSSDLTELRRKHGGDALAFYLMMIAHLDRWGCVPEGAATLRAMIVPTWEDVSADDINRWTRWMVRRGMLVKVTGPAGDRGLRSPDFHEHQRGTEFSREAPSRFEPADITAQWVRSKRTTKGADLQGGQRPVTGKSAASRRPAGVKGKEGKGSTTTLPPSPTPSPPPVESAGSGLELDPLGAQAQPPEAEINGNGHEPDRPRLDMEAIAAEAPPIVRDAILRARRKAMAE